LITLLSIPHFEWNAGLLGASWKSLGSMKSWPRWRKLKWAIASQPHRTCMAHPSSSRHLSQVASCLNPNLKRCPFRWQCPVNSPTVHLNWSLFNFNRSFVVLPESPDRVCFNAIFTAYFPVISLWQSLVSYVFI
jgi:hypothetical protein